ncbi:hypothetical protein ACFV0T_37500 [Streptomyces sp. NPDC059582]|uniref:hypothetical protein n=1 Tax=Streptomyces sp. NPDC059582 TaxID=3346875 RepID=UPI003685FCBF
MNHSSPPAPTSAEAQRLREVFADAAYDVTPSAVPLGAIEREGRRRRRRGGTAVLGASCAALLVLFAVIGLRDNAVSESGRSVRPSADRGADVSPSASKSAGRVRVVAPGERVRVAQGTEMWLTRDGSHWTEPDLPTQSRSVVDGNLDLGSPGVSLQLSTRADGRTFLSGIFHGPGEPARVEVTTEAGIVQATALTLAGRPGWGAWYAMTRLQDTPDTPSAAPWTVTVYGTSGGVLARQEYQP